MDNEQDQQSKTTWRAHKPEEFSRWRHSPAWQPAARWCGIPCTPTIFLYRHIYLFELRNTFYYSLCPSIGPSLTPSIFPSTFKIENVYWPFYLILYCFCLKCRLLILEQKFSCRHPKINGDFLNFLLPPIIYSSLSSDRLCLSLYITVSWTVSFFKLLPKRIF